MNKQPNERTGSNGEKAVGVETAANKAAAKDKFAAKDKITAKDKSAANAEKSRGNENTERNKTSKAAETGKTAESENSAEEVQKMLDVLPDFRGIFDSHAHYDDEKFDGIRAPLLEGLFSGGLSGIVTCGCDVDSSKAAIALSHQYKGMYAAVGFHPENLPPHEPELSALLPLLEDEKTVAVGEIGLDYYWDIEKPLQKAWFEAQLVFANRAELPVIVHDREAHADTLALLQKYKPRGVVHCFSGSVETAKELLKLGLYLGVGGVVTFKNARKTVEVCEMLPSDRLLLETDCPYLAPAPFRGKLCHSGLIAFTAARIAEIRGVTVEEIIKTSAENAKRLFKIAE